VTRALRTLGLRRLRRRLTPGGVIGAALLALVVACAVAAPVLAPHDPTRQNLRSRDLPPMWMAGGDATFPLGTDQLGRDLLSRLVHGARVSLAVGVLGTLVAVAVGVSVGSVAGFYGGTVDAVISRAIDTFMAIPFILLALAVVAVVGVQRGGDGGITLLVTVLGISGWADFARVARGETLMVRNLPFIESVQALGQRSFWILTRHVLPNIAAPITVLGALQVGTVIIAEASLSFVGLGVQPPGVTWGTMLADGRGYVATAWWLATFPGVAITLTVVASVLLGDWLRDVLDTRSR
jgi:peptide/nickel transport system permease protein